jgi:hypothetical protein
MVKPMPLVEPGSDIKPFCVDFKKVLATRKYEPPDI